MSSPTAAARKRVLIVDDDRALRHALATLLQGAGYAVEQAGDGTEGLVQLRRDGADVMLLDINLPGMSGLEVLEQAQALPSPPFVVMMTADGTPETVVRAVQGQAFRYIRKPFALPQMRARVRSWLARGAARRPAARVRRRRAWRGGRLLRRPAGRRSRPPSFESARPDSTRGR